MASSHQSDNSNLAAKLALRRHFLKTYHAKEAAHVFDCCQGSQVIWSQLRREFKIASYWGVDLKPKKGRLKIDSTRVLQQPGWTQNVIDVDVYGSPWAHWEAILKNGRGPLTVFLTIGQNRTGVVSNLSRAALVALGLGPLMRILPKGFHNSLGDLSVSYCLGRATEFGWTCVEGREAICHGNARYIGVRLAPTSGRGK
ncbi:MAG: hypothetical protein L0211_07435 [Planctomycetaceae bacterium]|nr:hypothetical protein [Planctomycetaceae bacterium]